jgi:23S rRNA pseudouridine1911/1915/1917 synthase
LAAQCPSFLYPLAHYPRLIAGPGITPPHVPDCGMASSHTVDQPATLLAFLFAMHPTAKKNTVRGWLRRGAVSVNDVATTQFDHPLSPGDVVSIGSARETRPKPRLPPGMTVRYEDDALLVIEKPEGLLSMASEGERDKTAQSYLTRYIRGGNPRSRDRAWVVHRLDRATSGVMVFAKSEAVMYALKDHWREVDKRYLAVIEGRLPDEHGTFESHLDESNAVKVRSTKPSERARHAVTHYQVIKTTAERTLVELRLETGRRNQIRVHLADACCPVVGDKTYGAQTDPAGRLALHAIHLEFAHPISGENLSFESPLPAKLARLV